GAALRLVVDPLALGAARGAGRPADFLHHGGGLDQLHQPGNRVLPVLFLGPMALGLDHYDPILADTVIPVLQQTRLAVLMQARGTVLETQFDGAGILVYILPLSSLGTNGQELHLLLVPLDTFRDLDHPLHPLLLTAYTRLKGTGEVQG